MQLNIKLLILSLDLHNKHYKVFKNKKSFTLIETIIVVAVLWILMMWTTIYLEWSDDKRRIIEAQWCAATIWWWINNYIYYALTSKSLRLESNNVVSPNFYYIKLNWWNSTDLNCNKDNNNLCDRLQFLYSTWNESSKSLYKTYSFSDTCNLSPSTKLRLYRDISSSDVPFIRMNKWFTPVNLNDSNIFYINKWNNILTWDIMIVLCLDNDCKMLKQFGKREIDWRTQTIALRNCAFYENDYVEAGGIKTMKCKTREGCRVYSGTDSTACEQY